MNLPSDHRTNRPSLNLLGEPMGPAAEPVYLADLHRCLPTTAIAPRLLPGCWRAIPYQTEAFSGTMLVTGEVSRSVPITYPIRRSGWHAIWIGVHSWWAGAVHARLSGDSAPTRFAIKPRPVPNGSTPRVWIEDLYWRVADLTHQDIEFSPVPVPVEDPSITPGTTRTRLAGLAYIKLVKLSDEQLDQHLQSQHRHAPNKRLFAHMDGFSYAFTHSPRTADDVRREIEPLRGGDFSRLYWEFGAGDWMFMPGAPGLSPVLDRVRSHHRAGMLYAQHAWESFARRGIDPFRVALDHAHELGMEFHATYRPAGFAYMPPQDEWNAGGLYETSPQWRGVARDGSSLPRLSYAYPEIRRHVIEYFTHAAKYPIDGVCIAFNRRCPLLEYEPPVIDSFMSRFGLDPRTLDENDPRWLKHRATFITEFLRELQMALANVSERLSKPKISISAIVLGSEEENMFNALDLRQWVSQGLVDTIIAYSSHERDTCSTWDTFTTASDSAYLRNITSGTATKLAVGLLPRQMSPTTYLHRARINYEAGVDHLFFWDADHRADMGRSWQTIRRLGHKSDILSRAGEIDSLPAEQGTFVRQVGEWDLRVQCPS